MKLNLQWIYAKKVSILQDLKEAQDNLDNQNRIKEYNGEYSVVNSSTIIKLKAQLDLLNEIIKKEMEEN